MGWKDRCGVSELIGKTLTEAEVNGDEILFGCSDRSAYKMFHDQDCCESVVIDSIDGEMDDLVGSPILMAEEISSDGVEPKDPSDATWGTYTWTFYKFATANGYVTVRWYGTSNGYYSESVDFEKTK